MRGRETKQPSMLMLMSPESVVPATHPLRGIKRLADAAPARMSSAWTGAKDSRSTPRITA